MRNNFKDYITTGLGILIMLLSVGNFYFRGDSTIMEFATGLILGWVFMIGDKELLHKLFLNVFKIFSPKKDGK